MLDVVYTRPDSLRRAGRSWLGHFIDAYLRALQAKKYKLATLRGYANRLLKFGEFLDQNGVREPAQAPQWVKPFVDGLHLTGPVAVIWTSVLTGFTKHLAQEGLVPPPPEPPLGPHAEIVAGYTCFLHRHRGLCEKTIKQVKRCCTSLAASLDASGVRDLGTLRPEHIHSFFINEGQRLSRKSLRATCCIVRGFLSYLCRQGVTPGDLSQVVVSPRIYRQEQCPRSLTRDEVKAILAAVDRRCAAGRRDYAMLLLLATYGLRGIEVIRLRLDDIDWRRQALSIRGRKAGNQTVYPLSASVGDAIVAYLKDGRPESDHREVFLTGRAPFGPFAAPVPLAAQVRKFARLAGVRAHRLGTHTFRYSCAQRLLEHGVPLKAIGDYLGHSDPSSTERYTKMDIDRLRLVALGDGEDLL